ncbi:GroES-like protein [Pilatotrama ljubarskyi]|nr:GroES-like protein [Pilatotrama ljubarskyi]
MSSTNQLEFKGYAMTDPSAWSSLSVVPFEPKALGPEDVEVAVAYCGLCGSDVHMLNQSWGSTRQGPLIVGHEIVGRVTRVGEKVRDLKPGDRVGVGAAVGSCMQCRACNDNYENYCRQITFTINSQWPDGTPVQGGFSTGVRAHERFVFPIPDGVELRHAASMMCGGITVYAPLRENGCGPGKKVGVLGIGGLGHYAILFAKAMGAEVYAFTRGTAKAEDAKKMGADHVVDTTVDGFWKPYDMTLDIIISTVDHFPKNFSLRNLLSMLYVHGKFIVVGLPPADEPMPTLHAFDLTSNAGCFIGGSLLGSKDDMKHMLNLAAEKGVKPWIEELPMNRAKEALEGLKAGKPRYRYVLKQDIAPVD